MDDIRNKLSGLKTSLLRDLPYIIFTLALPAVTVLGLVYPPALTSQGQAHRIFYTHVPVAWVALYAPAISAVCGILFLLRRRESFDVWSHANAKLAFLFALGVCISGPIWASTEWGSYWNFQDERLMSFSVLVLCLGGYFLVRYMTEDERRRRVFAAFMAVVSALAAVMTWFAIRLIQSDTHPGSVLGTMSPKIRITFWLSVLGYHLVFWVMVRLAVRQEYVKRLVLRAEAQAGAPKGPAV